MPCSQSRVSSDKRIHGAANALLYAEIGHEVRRRGHDSVSQRAIVPASRKLALLMQAHVVQADARHGAGLPPVPETRFLIDAVAAAPLPMLDAPADAAMALPWWRFGARAVWVLDLFERLEREEREAQTRRREQPVWASATALHRADA